MSVLQKLIISSMLSPCYVRPNSKRLKLFQVYAERLYALAQDAFEKTDKALVESQLTGFFIDGLYV